MAYLKSQGLQPEQVLVRVKATRQHVGLAKRDHGSDAFVEGLITLCLEEFYKG